MTTHPAAEKAQFSDAVQAGARAMYEADRDNVPEWDDLSEAREYEVCNAFAAGMEAMWRPIETAPRDGTPVLLRFKNPLVVANRPDVQRWNGIKFVGRNRGDPDDWAFAAPVGMGGFPDHWLDGWQPLPAPPRTTKE